MLKRADAAMPDRADPSAVSPTSAAQTAPERVTPMAGWVLAVLMMFYALNIIDKQVINLLVQSIKIDLGLTDTQISLVLGPAFFIPYFLMAVPAAWVGDRISRRLAIFVGVTVWSLSAAGSGLASSFALLFLARWGVGSGEAALPPSAYPLLAAHFPRRRLGFATGIYQSSQKVGTAIAFGLGAYLIHVAGDLISAVPWLSGLKPWQLVLVLTGAPGVLLAPLIFTVSEGPKGRAPPPKPDDREFWRFIKKNAALLALLCVGFSCITATAGALMSWTPAYVERHFGWPPTRTGPWMGAVSLVASAALIFKGALMDWLYNRGMSDAHVRFYTWLSIAAFPLLATMFFIPSPEVFLLIYGGLQVLTLTFLVFLTPALQIFTPPQLRSRVMALFLMGFSIFGSIGPVCVGVITDYVVRDEQKLGISLSIVVTFFVLVSITLLRWSLPRLRAAMEAAVAEPARA
jgi:MFS family permease